MRTGDSKFFAIPSTVESHPGSHGGLIENRPNVFVENRHDGGVAEDGFVPLRDQLPLCGGIKVFAALVSIFIDFGVGAVGLRNGVPGQVVDQVLVVPTRRQVSAIHGPLPLVVLQAGP